MRGTSLKITGLSVLAALAAAPSAQAALAGGENFDAKNGPDLRTVTVLQDPEAGNRTELVRFCFDRRLQPEDIGPNDERNDDFRLIGYDSSDEVRSIRATLDQGREDSDAERCVVVEFPSTTDTSRFTVGAVEDNAVFAASGGNQGNLEDAVGVTKVAEQGITALPNLIKVVTDIGRNELIYTFDEPLGDDEFGDDANDFGYYDDEGNREEGDDAQYDDSRRTVRVRFDLEVNSPGATVADAERAYVRGGTVEDQGPDNDNRFESAPVQDPNGNITDNQVSSRPDLLSASISGPNTVRYVFDADCILDSVGLDADGFVIRDFAGNQLAGDHAIVLQGPDTPADGRTVEVTFPDDGGASNIDIDVYDVQAGVRQGSVACNGFGDDAVNAGNTFGSVALGGASKITKFEGFTSAPDAVSATFNQQNAKVTIKFDQEIDDSTVDLSDFTLYGDNGNELIPANPVEQTLVDGDTIILQLANGQANGIRGIGIEEDAFAGARGDLNVSQIVVVKTKKAANGNNTSNPQPGAGGGGGGGTTTPPNGGNKTPDAAKPGSTVAGAGAQAPTARVSPARSGKAAKARVLYAKYRNGSLVMKVAGKAKTAKVRISLRNAKGKTVKTITRTVKTNRQVTLKRLSKSSAIKSVRIRVL